MGTDRPAVRVVLAEHRFWIIGFSWYFRCRRAMSARSLCPFAKVLLGDFYVHDRELAGSSVQEVSV